MTIHTTHSAGECEVCAAQQEADEIGAIPVPGHQHPHLEVVIARLTNAIYHGSAAANAKANIRDLLFEFADEIKRQAIEP